MMELAIILAGLSMLMGLAWFLFKIWLFFFGLRFAGLAMQEWASKHEGGQTEADESEFGSPDIFSSPAPEGYGRHISQVRPVNQRREPPKLRLVRGGKA
tara:strand:+ start:208 stop:504 length:297 start_codon:yes stop_codon:yes gene_type:complete